MASCQCGGGLGKLGTPNCVNQEKVKARSVFLPLYDSEGNRNSILNTDFVNGVLPDSYVQGKLDEIDASKRWNITPDTYEEVAPSRTDRITQTSSGGTIRELQKGVKTYDAQLWNVPTAWSSLINQGGCLELGEYTIDITGKLGGELSADGSELYPRAIQPQSLVAEDFDATNTEGQYTKLTYQLSRTADEAQFFAYGADALETDFLSARSLIQAELTGGSGVTTATDVFVTLKDFAHNPVRGQDEIADWSVLDALLAPVTISAVEEVADGEYKLTITSTPAETLTVDFVKVRTSSNAILYCASAILVVTP
jgi:hypothetical protein